MLAPRIHEINREGPTDYCVSCYYAGPPLSQMAESERKEVLSLLVRRVRAVLEARARSVPEGTQP